MKVFCIPTIKTMDRIGSGVRAAHRCNGRETNQAVEMQSRAARNCAKHGDMVAGVGEDSEAVLEY